MSRQDSTWPAIIDKPANNFVPPWPETQPPRHTVVQADNKPVGADVTAIAYAVLFLAFVLSSWALWDLANWPLALVILVLVPLYMYLGYRVLRVVSGDEVAYKEVAGHHRSQREAIRYHAGLLQLQEENRHREEMLRLDIEKLKVETNLQLERVRMDIADLSRRLLKDGGGEVVVNDLSTFVPNVDDRIRNMAVQCIAELYRDGKPDPKLVQLGGKAPGLLKKTVPWSGRGGWTTEDSGEVLRWLTERHVVSRHHNNFKLDLDRFPTLASIGRL